LNEPGLVRREMMMPKFKFESRAGADLGVYEGATATDAFLEMIETMADCQDIGDDSTISCELTDYHVSQVG
jgi:hypothetical protein